MFIKKLFTLFALSLKRTVTWLFHNIIQILFIYLLIASLLIAWILSYTVSIYEQRFLHTQEEKMTI